MRKKHDALEALLLGLTLVFFTSLFLVVVLQILTRFSSRVSFVWTEEFARLLFVASIAASAPLAYKHGEFIAVDFLLEKLRTKHKRLVLTCMRASLLAMFVIIFIYGIGFAKLGLTQTSPTLGIPMALPYSSIAFSSFFFIYYLTRELIQDAYRRRGL